MGLVAAVLLSLFADDGAELDFWAMEAGEGVPAGEADDAAGAPSDDAMVIGMTAFGRK